MLGIGVDAGIPPNQAHLATAAGGFAAGAALCPVDSPRSICCFAAQGMAYVAMPFLLQNTLGLSQVSTGLLLTPWPLTVALIAPVGGPALADRYPPAILGAGSGWRSWRPGLVCMATLAGPSVGRWRSSGARRSAAWDSASSIRRTTAPCSAQHPAHRSGRRQRHGRNRAPAGPDAGRGAGGALLRNGPAAWAPPAALLVGAGFATAAASGQPTAHGDGCGLKPGPRRERLLSNRGEGDDHPRPGEGQSPSASHRPGRNWRAGR